VAAETKNIIYLGLGLHHWHAASLSPYYLSITVASPSRDGQDIPEWTILLQQNDPSGPSSPLGLCSVRRAQALPVLP
jgi:hypothetical protein